MELEQVNQWVYAEVERWLEAGLITDVQSTGRTLVITARSGRLIGIYTFDILHEEL